MARFTDLTGQRFGMLVVLKQAERGRKGQIRWLCQCDCGNQSVVPTGNLKNGHSTSCGCLIKTTNVKHGHWNTRVYRIYHAMKQRCYNPNNAAYEYYGGRGIKICKEWLDDFMNFYNWAMANGYDDTKSIDRINVDGDYEPSNCRWSTGTIQTYNQGKRKDNSTGVVGVSFRKDIHKYQAYITKEHKTVKLGTFETLEEAVRAREEAEKKYY